MGAVYKHFSSSLWLNVLGPRYLLGPSRSAFCICFSTAAPCMDMQHYALNVWLACQPGESAFRVPCAVDAPQS